MRVSKIFDNGKGDKYEVICDFTDSLNSPKWTVRVAKKPKGKRKFTFIGSSDETLRFKVPYGEYDAYRYKEYAKEIPWSWVDEVMDELVAKIREFGNAIKPKTI